MTEIMGVNRDQLRSFGELIYEIGEKMEETAVGRFLKDNLLLFCLKEYAINIIDGEMEYLYSILIKNGEVEVVDHAAECCSVVFDIEKRTLLKVLAEGEQLRRKPLGLLKYFFRYYGAAKLLDDASYIRELVGSRVRLRRFKEEELQQILLWYIDRELNRMAGFAYNEPTLDKLRSNMLSSFGKDPMNLVIEELETGKAIGTIQLYDINRFDGNCMLGIRIGEKDRQGKGLGPEAIKLLVDYAFDTLKLKRVSLKVYEYNENAKKCYEKIGFEIEGRLRKSAKVEDTYYDEILMSMINSRE